MVLSLARGTHGTVWHKKEQDKARLGKHVREAGSARGTVGPRAGLTSHKVPLTNGGALANAEAQRRAQFRCRTSSSQRHPGPEVLRGKPCEGRGQKGCPGTAVDAS